MREKGSECDHADRTERPLRSVKQKTAAIGFAITAVTAALFAVTGCGINPAMANAAKAAVGAGQSAVNAAKAAVGAGQSAVNAAKAAVGAARVEQITMYSQALHADMKVDVYLPPGYTARHKYPVLYLLHGLNGNQNSWMSTWYGRGIGIDKDATRLIRAGAISPLIIVTPEIDNSYGIDTAQKRHNVGGYTRGMYARYLSHDLIDYIDSHYSAEQTAAGRYIGGYSMGGFAALHLAFTRPDLYSRVGTMSAALWVGGLPQVLAWIYPTAKDQAARDPITIATRHRLNVPVEMIEGTSDPFYYADTKLAQVLKQNDVARTLYFTYRGGHDEAFWRSHASQLLLFFAGPKNTKQEGAQA